MPGIRATTSAPPDGSSRRDGGCRAARVALDLHSRQDHPRVGRRRLRRERLGPLGAGLVIIVHQPIALFTQYLIARAHQKAISFALIAAVIANVVLSVVMAYTVGLWGVAASTLVTDVAVLAFVIPKLIAPISDIRTRDLLRAMGRPLLPGFLVAVVLLGLLGRLYPGHRLLEFVPLGVLWLVVGGAAVWRFGFDEDERSRFVRGSRRQARGWRLRVAAGRCRARRARSDRRGRPNRARGPPAERPRPGRYAVIHPSSAQPVPRRTPAGRDEHACACLAQVACHLVVVRDRRDAEPDHLADLRGSDPLVPLTRVDDTSKFEAVASACSRGSRPNSSMSSRPATRCSTLGSLHR